VPANLSAPDFPAPRASSPSSSSQPQGGIVDPDHDPIAEPPLSDAEPAGLTGHPKRTLGIVVICFLVGMLAMAFYLYRSGRLGPEARAGTLEDTVERARSALRLKHFDEPPGDNVKEITNEGLTKWPRDARLREVREIAADEVVHEAVGQQIANHLDRALALARLAHDLDPTDTTAENLVERYEAERAKAQAAPTPSGKPAPSASAGAGHPLPGTNTHVAPPAPGGLLLHAALVATPAKPRIGQQVDLVAKVTTLAGTAPKGAAEEPHFQIVGPGGFTSQLPAIVESSGSYRASFAFLEAGTYQVVFTAKVDGAPVKAMRQLVAGDATAPPPGTPSAAPSETPPVPSAKWM
jgi:hypothetical protein